MSDKFELLSSYDNLSIKHKLPKEIKAIITDNLNPKFAIRSYQKEAFIRLEEYIELDDDKNQPVHLLFQMATGSGKTLVMAGAVLHLYQLGYRNFLFFVNSDNVLEKTKDNFLNTNSSKYLFADTIKINNRIVAIRSCSNFDYVNCDDINICFTTIQKLHIDLQTPAENAPTYEDFKDKKVVLLADEAHHINGATKQQKSLLAEESYWENTVMSILNSNIDNILLEFTATAELTNKDIAKKYNDKLIYNYSLMQFCKDKYSKDVQILQTESSVLHRAIIACILSEYRLHIFADYKMNIKPVVMLKSKRATKKADDGTVITSSDFKKLFLEHIATITGEQLLELANSTANNEILTKAFNYFRQKDSSLNNLAYRLQQNFTESTSILIDSSNNINKKENQLLVNSLENHDNHIRAVFAVDALNEGWDVLNLFDIVRLYNTVEPVSKKSNDTVGNYTISEAQLIGRGARYCPFEYENLSKYQRKFDNDLNHDLRICESLYYHSQQNSSYISQLRRALDVLGIPTTNTTVVKRLRLKDSFKQSKLYQNYYVWSNEQNDGDIVGYSDLYNFQDIIFEVKLLSSNIVHIDRLLDDNSNVRMEIQHSFFKVKDFCHSVVRKAIALNPFYQFYVLRQYFITDKNALNNLDMNQSNLRSITEFIASDHYLANIQIQLQSYEKYTNTNQLSINQQLFILNDILKQIQLRLMNNISKKTGSKIFYPQAIHKIFKDKDIRFPVIAENSTAEYGLSMTETQNNHFWLDLSQEKCAWYAYNENYGTNQEKSFVKFMQDEAIPYLHDKYGVGNVFVLRNEQVIKLYNFNDDRALSPDFIMFILQKAKIKKELVYQVFIEPKGEHLKKHDLWKQEFLQSIKNDAICKCESIFDGFKYKLLGLKFYTHSNDSTQDQRLEFLAELKQEL